MATCSRSTQLRGDDRRAAARLAVPVDHCKSQPAFSEIAGAPMLLMTIRTCLARASRADDVALQVEDRGPAATAAIGILGAFHGHGQEGEALLNPFMTGAIFRVCSRTTSIANSTKIKKWRAVSRGSGMGRQRFAAAARIVEPGGMTRHHMGQDWHLARRLNLLDRLERHGGVALAASRPVGAFRSANTAGARP